MDKNLARGPTGSGYYLFGLARVARARAAMGVADTWGWYKRAKKKLLTMQKRNGAFPTGYGKGVGTAFAVLTLVYGQKAALANGKGGEGASGPDARKNIARNVSPAGSQ